MGGRIGDRGTQLLGRPEQPDPAQISRRAAAVVQDSMARQALPFRFEQTAPGIHICGYRRRQLRRHRQYNDRSSSPENHASLYRWTASRPTGIKLPMSVFLPRALAMLCAAAALLCSSAAVQAQNPTLEGHPGDYGRADIE